MRIIGRSDFSATPFFIKTYKKDLFEQKTNETCQNSMFFAQENRIEVTRAYINFKHHSGTTKTNGVI
ncbi:hypothetical protein CTT31_07000 [Pseudoalteromonas maricaloris]|nr:hypothetical protein CTT31_07000 [Pseudoalteromonas flavipulchra]